MSFILNFNFICLNYLNLVANTFLYFYLKLFKKMINNIDNNK